MMISWNSKIIREFQCGEVQLDDFFLILPLAQPLSQNSFESCIPPFQAILNPPLVALFS
jgi:hypothetical protein